jgi:hypothetical protein
MIMIIIGYKSVISLVTRVRDTYTLLLALVYNTCKLRFLSSLHSHHLSLFILLAYSMATPFEQSAASQEAQEDIGKL